MMGLLLKDLYVAKKNLRAYLLMILVFTGASLLGDGSGSFCLCYGIVMMPGITMSLISYDERYHWECYVGAMPISQAQVVTEKYLLHLIMVLVWLPVTVSVQHFQNTPAFGGSPLLLLATELTTGLLLAGILLPIMFAIGTEKGRVGYYVVLFGGMILAAVADTLSAYVGCTSEGASWFLLLLLPLAVYAFSWRIAIILYKKRNL